MLASPIRLSTRALLVTSSAIIAAMVGCGGGSDTSTGSFGGNSGTSSTTTTVGKGGEGGTLFNFSSLTMTGSNEGGTGTGGSTGSTTTTTTMMPVCDGNPTTGPGKWAVKNGDDTQGQYAQAVAADASGNVYVTGSYLGTFAIGTMPLSNADTVSMFVTKLNASGTPQWVRGYSAGAPGGNGVPRVAGQAIATDDQGSVYVLGDFTGVTTIIPPSPPAPAGTTAIRSTGGFFGDSFLLKYNTGGTLTWASRIGETQPSDPNGKFGTQVMHGIAVRKTATSQDVLVGGDTQGTLDLGNGIILPANPMASRAALVAVYRGNDGVAKVGFLFGDGTNDQSVYGVAWDPNGDIVVTGFAQGTITFPGNVTLTSAGTQAAFVAKIKGDGSSTVWAKLYGSKTAIGKAVAVDAAGNIFVTGDHKGDIDFGGGVLSNNFGDNVFVAKLDGAGNHVWSHTYGDSTGQQALSIAVDGMGRAVVGGEYTGKIDFGGGELTAAGQNGFLAKLDTHGCQVWAKNIGDAALQSVKGVALDPSGNVSIAGVMLGSVAVGNTTLMSPATDLAGDMFVGQFGP